MDGLKGIGSTGHTFLAHGLVSTPGCPSCAHIQNVTLRNIDLQTGGAYDCNHVDGLVVEGVKRWPEGSTCTPSVDAAVPQR